MEKKKKTSQRCKKMKDDGNKGKKKATKQTLAVGN